MEQIQPEVSRLKYILARYSRQIWLTWILFSASIPVIYFILFNLHIRARNLEKNIIPIERIGLYGESDLNGLAQRVATTFEKDLILKDVSTVYVAQNGSTIVLKGAIANSRMLQRMTDIAKDVKGVTEVDTSQINVISSEAVQPSKQLSPN
ncbi:LuxR family two component transcriptional regulator (fragment) [Hyella patelloides LEGE 07179]|uniref:LuxR family two component transcriptional regulator n=1 Tax=Hyella patelloides LEGE 07179 TaxID=945734 RepID=A0A563VS31_9CYAN